MSTSTKVLPYCTYEDWEQLEGQWELIEGIPLAMEPMAVPRHQRIAGSLLTEFNIQFKKCKNCTAYEPIDYRISDDTILQPDMLVVCQEISKKYLDFPPSLVAEVLSPSTVLKDRNTKYHLYERQGIKYYLIVDIEKEIV